MVELDLILLAPIDGREWVGVYRYLEAWMGLRDRALQIAKSPAGTAAGSVSKLAEQLVF
jgi:hypothetical protein